MKNKISPKIGKPSRKIIRMNKSEDGEVVFREYSDGTAQFTFYGEIQEYLSWVCKKQNISLKKLVKEIISADMARREKVVAVSGKAVVA